jgi:4-alpha-glucanotransferase
MSRDVTSCPRRAGILLHPTSLPGPGESGDVGPQAHRFVDFLVQAGLSVWQTLPLAPAHEGGSPYQCLSVHAGSPLLISLERLAQDGWLDAAALPQREPNPPANRQRCLAQAWEGFQQKGRSEDEEAFAAFKVDHSHWLDDYALYVALRQLHEQRSWSEWPTPLRDRDPNAIEEARRRLAPAIEQQYFEQFVFFRQWEELKAYANQRGVLMFGDMPIFVAHDSADVWARREYFDLDECGQPKAVAGVPPDYFSESGQRWGNPLYHWPRLSADGFCWWLERMATQLRFFDLIRVDHFRGFQAYWAIPAEDDTAVNGRWVEAPGDDLFAALRDHFGALPLVAEDLGLITPEVEALRDKYELPGMKVLQFAFDGGPDNPYLPHQHIRRCVMYTGTHDNDTTLGWFQSLPKDAQQRVQDYLGWPGEPMPWPLIRAAFASVAELAVIPLQDPLMLGSEARMNRPSLDHGNWRWRFRWDWVPDDLTARLRHLTEIYGRCPVSPRTEEAPG